jgi:hypothetical protein
MEELAFLSATIKSLCARFYRLEAVLTSELHPRRGSGRRGGGSRLPAPTWEEQRSACADARASVTAAYSRGHRNSANFAGPVSAVASSAPTHHSGKLPSSEAEEPPPEPGLGADPGLTESAATEEEAASHSSLPRPALWVRELQGGELREETEAEDDEYVPPATSSDYSSESDEYSEGEDSLQPDEVAALLADADVSISKLIPAPVGESAPFHHEQLAARPEKLVTVAAWPATTATFKSSATEPAAPLTWEQQVEQQVDQPMAGGTEGNSSSDSEPVHGDKLRSRLRQLRSESEGSAEAARGLSEVQVADKPAAKETLPEPAPPAGLHWLEAMKHKAARNRAAERRIPDPPDDGAYTWKPDQWEWVPTYAAPREDLHHQEWAALHNSILYEGPIPESITNLCLDTECQLCGVVLKSELMSRSHYIRDVTTGMGKVHAMMVEHELNFILWMEEQPEPTLLAGLEALSTGLDEVTQDIEMNEMRHEMGHEMSEDDKKDEALKHRLLARHRLVRQALRNLTPSSPAASPLPAADSSDSSAY